MTNDKQKEKLVNVRLGKTNVENNHWLNWSVFSKAKTEKNYGLNVGVVGGVEGDNYGLNVGVGVGVEGDNYGLNVGVGGVVGDNYGLNVGVVGDVESSKHTTLGRTFPKATKYLPKAIKDLGLPSFNVGGLITYTKNPESTGIFGTLVNVINNENGNADYVSTGLLNVEFGDGLRITPFFGARMEFDGIFRHKSDLEKKVEATE